MGSKLLGSPGRHSLLGSLDGAGAFQGTTFTPLSVGYRIIGRGIKVLVFMMVQNHLQPTGCTFSQVLPAFATNLPTLETSIVQAM